MAFEPVRLRLKPPEIAGADGVERDALGAPASVPCETVWKPVRAVAFTPPAKNALTLYESPPCLFGPIGTGDSRARVKSLTPDGNGNGNAASGPSVDPDGGRPELHP